MGAGAGGTFDLAGGEALRVSVGGAGAGGAVVSPYFAGVGGGGGGSFIVGEDPVLLARVSTGDGWVTVAPLGATAVPEPSGLAPFGAGLVWLASLRRRRRR